MKTAVSIPDDVFREAECLARSLKTSRSRLYSRALNEFLARHEADRVTAQMDQVCGDLGPQPDEFVREAARRVLKRIEW